MARTLEKTQVMEGSRAIAASVQRCRPQVIAAYPITPQTHIVEYLAQAVANGQLNAEYVKVESEHSAISAVLGAEATGARSYTASSSQGVLLMNEVLYNVAALRLPVVMTVANRAISQPINIWNDHQDAMSARDTGFIQIFAEDNQEACDLHYQAYKIAEHKDVLLPVMVCVDGYVLTHSYEPVSLLDQDMADDFLPPYEPSWALDVDRPITYGVMLGPGEYLEHKYVLQQAQKRALGVIEDVAREFGTLTGRMHAGLVEAYRLEDAEVALVGMGSLVSSLREAADELREQGIKAGVLKIRTFRPFPADRIVQALAGVRRVVVIDKGYSLGSGGILGMEVTAALAAHGVPAVVDRFTGGLGGRPIPASTVVSAVLNPELPRSQDGFLDLKPAYLGEGD